jgi:arabinan endo-1,5-alpha-L-arabinosidase
VFGSFWDGIKLVKLTPDRLHVAEPLDHLPTIASRKTDPAAPNPAALTGNPSDAGSNAIEAPFIFRNGGYYYLFASIDYCCKGAASTYKMIVGRAEKLAGPYVDEDGVPLARGGGRILLAGDARWYGVGHCGVYDFDGVTYLIFHGYDATAHGIAKLRIEKLQWTEAGWPRVVLSAP